MIIMHVICVIHVILCQYMSYNECHKTAGLNVHDDVIYCANMFTLFIIINLSLPSNCSNCIYLFAWLLFTIKHPITWQYLTSLQNIDFYSELFH